MIVISSFEGSSPLKTAISDIISLSWTSTSLTITGNYKFIGLRSNSGAMYLTEIVVTYGTLETAENVSNFIMINDTANQCTTKLNQAINEDMVIIYDIVAICQH